MGVGNLLRLLVTIALLAAILLRLDPRTLGEAFAGLRPAPAVGVFTGILAAIGLSAWKWGLILSSRGIQARFRKLIRLYFIGLFFNNLLPTAVGGDVVRGWALGKETGDMPEAAGSVVSERLIGGVALGLSSLLGLPFVHLTPRLLWLVVAFLTLDAVLVGLFVLPRVGTAITRTLIPVRFAAAMKGTGETLAAVRATLLDRGLVLRVLIVTIVFQGSVSLVNFFLFSALDHPVSVGLCLVFTPMISTVTMLPISLSGLGVREAAYVYFFAAEGVPAPVAVAASLLFFATVALTTLPGAPLFLMARRRGGTAGL